MNGSVFSMMVVAVAFALLVWWVYKPSNKQRFDEYASMPLQDDIDATTGDDDHNGDTPGVRS